jgi:hypothetical protein
MSDRRWMFVLVALVAALAYGCNSQSPTAPQTVELAGLDAGLSSEAKLPKVDVCHITGNGKYVFINISGNALPAHLAHGDSLPGENGLDDQCQAVTAFVEFLELTVSFFGEGVVIGWTVDGTTEPVTYFVEGFDAFGSGDWLPIFPDDVVVGTGQGTYSAIDVFFFDEYRVRAVDGDGNEVISETISPF